MREFGRIRGERFALRSYRQANWTAGCLRSDARSSVAVLASLNSMAAVALEPRIVARTESCWILELRMVRTSLTKKAMQDRARATPAATAVSRLSFAASVRCRASRELRPCRSSAGTTAGGQSVREVIHTTHPH